MRFGVIAGAIAAVLALSAVPAAHVHHFESGGVLVHSHVEANDDDHADTLDHGDHAGVATLRAAFVVAHAPQLTMPSRVVAVPVAPPVDMLIGAPIDGSPPNHGPPVRIRSLRAPPA